MIRIFVAVVLACACTSSTWIQNLVKNRSGSGHRPRISSGTLKMIDAQVFYAAYIDYPD